MTHEKNEQQTNIKGKKKKEKNSTKRVFNKKKSHPKDIEIYIINDLRWHNMSLCRYVFILNCLWMCFLSPAVSFHNFLFVSFLLSFGTIWCSFGSLYSPCFVWLKARASLFINAYFTHSLRAFFFCFFSSSMKSKLLQKDYVINITKARAKMFGADFIQYLVFGYVVTFHPLFDQFFIFLLFHCCCFLCIFSLFRVRFVIFIFVIFLLFVSFAFILDWKSIAYS